VIQILLDLQFQNVFASQGIMMTSYQSVRNVLSNVEPVFNLSLIV
jgi:hypothetical protein